MKTSAIVRQIGVIAAFIATLGMNFLSQGAANFNIALFPRTVAQLGEMYPIYFLPAGYVFAVWGVIYLGLGAFVVYHSRVGRSNPLMQRVGWLFIVTCLANIAWLILFLNEQFALSTVAMLILLGALISIYQTQRIGLQAVTPTVRWMAHIPFSIYLGWITVATVANVTYVLFDAQWDGFGISGELWAAVMMAAATFITGLMIVRRSDFAYALVVIWALIGIIARYPNVTLVALAAGASATLIAILIVLELVRSRLRIATA
ncbi:MAG: TspO/MBR family protein [Aggregatilineales bacterium]